MAEMLYVLIPAELAYVEGGGSLFNFIIDFLRGFAVRVKEVESVTKKNSINNSVNLHSSSSSSST